MNSNCAFYIGTTHEVCQDYALANNGSIVVSDGCSGSINSDIGSRILSITAMNKIAEIDSLKEFEEKECILLARPSVKMLNISNECLDATLLAVSKKDNELEAMCCGDGTITIKTKDGILYVIDCVYTDSYPFYMNYLCSRDKRYENWIQLYNKREITISLIGNRGEVSELAQKHIDTFRINDFCVLRKLDHKILLEIADIESIEHISIMSDGIHSFYETVITETSKYNKSISYLEVLKELLAFKNYNKTFVQRRINKFRKDCIKKNWANADDVSLASIYVGD